MITIAEFIKIFFPHGLYRMKDINPNAAIEYPKFNAGMFRYDIIICNRKHPKNDKI